MSGPTSSDQPQDTAQQAASTDMSTMDVDPAASLRALALSTLKRRKITTPNSIDVSASIPTRPIINDNSIQLNYGTDEPSSGASFVDSSAAGTSSPARSPPPPIPPQTTAMEVDDDLEEGEISDSESTPAPKTTPAIPPKTVPAKPRPTALNLPMRPPASSPLATSSQLPKTGTTVDSLPEPPASASVQSTASVQRFTPSDYKMDLADDFEIRPGLKMTQTQYDTAKDLVLDLLGWGVPPEYLVGCGLSREIIYFVFLELNLRLPTNLDTSGLPPPTTGPSVPVHYASPEPISPAASSFHRQRSQSIASTRQSQGHPSLPQKPSAPQGRTVGDGASLSATATLGTPSTPATPETATSLIDMELQRRQELLARKAVLASRKSKQASSTTSTPTSVTTTTRVTLESRISDPKQAETVASVPKQAVDDFLNSIGSAAAESSSQTIHDDEMDVDGPIPGLSATIPTSAQLIPSRKLSEAPSTAASDVLSSNVAFPSMSDSESSNRRLSVVRNANGRSMSRSDEKSDTSDPQTREPSLGPRRGTKRPVAADFVDMEPGSSRSHFSGYTDYYGAHHVPRRRPQSFAGVTTSRRMVIHLSDTSEDDEDESAEDTGPSVAHSHRPHHRSRHGNRLAVASSAPTIGSPNGASTPAALLEKEQEIKKMREMIALRERARKDKLAATSKGSTPPVVVNGEEAKPVTIKQEEDDNAASVSFTYTTSSSFRLKDESDGHTGESETPAPGEFVTTTDSNPPPGEHCGTGDQVQQESVAAAPTTTITATTVSPEETSKSPVDSVYVGVGDSASENPSAQDFGIPHNSPGSSQFVAYRSPLSSYPLLRAHSPRSLADSSSSSGTDPYSAVLNPPLRERPDSDDPLVLIGINLRTMKAAAVNRWLSDPSRRLCRYEVPGGGECRDRNCEDIHPSLAWMVEPSDEETARHLYAGLPKSSPVTLEQLQTALQEARHPDVDYHARTRNALDTLGLRTQP
ncbi:hypothetical protein BC835DRAFT_1351463 [Cytidiella melzeri]|nr:hypothetical protein BC835DRAFT_1351463 [Cytidiella melzeri]